MNLPETNAIALTARGNAEKSLSAVNWAETGLGAADRWPQSLQTTVNILSYISSPTLLLWGGDATIVYNDAFSAQLPAKLQNALGKHAADVWPAQWTNIQAIVGQVLTTQEAVISQQSLFGLTGIFQYSYTPVIGENVVASGVMVSCTKQNVSDAGHRLHITESEERFRALVTATSDVVYRMNPDWTVLQELNGRGFLADTNKPVENWIDKYVLPEDREHMLKSVGEAIANKSIFRLEHQVLKADGTTGWTDSCAIPVLDEKGQIVEWFGTATDVTARKKTEKDLQQARDDANASKRLYEAITASTPDLIYIFDLNYRFIYANRALLAMWGKTAEEAAGQRLLALGYEPWHAEMHEREIDQILATKKSVRGTVSFPHAVLGRRIYDYLLSPVFNSENEVIAVAGVTRDISDQVHAEEALKQSGEQFRMLTTSLPQLVWTSRPDGYFDFFNQQWYDYTGSTSKTAYGDGWAQFIHPQHREGLFTAWQNSLQTGESIEYQFQLRDKNGNYQWFYVIGNPIRDEHGVIKKWVGALTNIEAQKVVEERLEHLVAERTVELKRSNEDLQQFAHVASHDMKEPVRKVKIFAGRLETDPDTHLSANGKLFLEKINSATDRMSSMIEGVLKYAILSNAEQTVSDIDLNEVMKNIEGDLEVPINLKGAQISYDHLPSLQGASVLIYQLFYNLVYNALKFTKADVAPQITIRALSNDKADDKLTIEVADNGIGFSEDQSEKIFNTFTRLNARDKYDGTGLGLALCKKIVERHGGSIKASGREGEGAVFTIALPIK